MPENSSRMAARALSWASLNLVFCSSTRFRSFWTVGELSSIGYIMVRDGVNPPRPNPRPRPPGPGWAHAVSARASAASDTITIETIRTERIMVISQRKRGKENVSTRSQRRCGKQLYAFQTPLTRHARKSCGEPHFSAIHILPSPSLGLQRIGGRRSELRRCRVLPLACVCQRAISMLPVDRVESRV